MVPRQYLNERPLGNSWCCWRHGCIYKVTARGWVDSFKPMTPLVAVQCGCPPLEKLRPSPGMRTTRRWYHLNKQWMSRLLRCWHIQRIQRRPFIAYLRAAFAQPPFIEKNSSDETAACLAWKPPGGKKVIRERVAKSEIKIRKRLKGKQQKWASNFSEPMFALFFLIGFQQKSSFSISATFDWITEPKLAKN